MNQKNLIVEVNTKDKEWLTSDILEAISKKTKVKLEFSNQTPNILGGCRVESKDGKIAFDGTLDSRFNELKIILRPKIAKLLFGDET